MNPKQHVGGMARDSSYRGEKFCDKIRNERR